MSYTYQYPRPALKDLPELAFDHDEIMTDAITLYGRLTSKNEKMRTASIADLDEMYEDPAFCKENGKWQMVFGVVTHPSFQHQGCASRLMNQFILHAKEEGKSGIVLTCKKEKISFYEQFGFKNEGLSTSTHGGVPWYQMRLSF